MIPPVSEPPGDGGHQKKFEDLPAAPAHLSYRIPSLDILRGIAVSAALFISIWVFGGIRANQPNALLIKSKGFDYRLFGTMDILFNGKMRALIAIVFGAGMIVFLSKENQKNQIRSADLFIIRQLWLIIFGLINALIFCGQAICFFISVSWASCFFLM